MSNDRRQIVLERELRKLGYLYIRKRQSKAEARVGSLGPKRWAVRKEEFAQAVAATEFEPWLVRQGRDRLFEEDWYGKVFPTDDPNYYLSRLWLVRAASRHVDRDRERAYAKWLVVRQAWAEIEPRLRSPRRRIAFREALESRANLLDRVDGLLDAVFTAGMAFFRASRADAGERQDAGTFFRKRGLPKDFDSYLGAGPTRHRTRLEKASQRFAAALDEVLT
jgi:hypothetical protein